MNAKNLIACRRAFSFRDVYRMIKNGMVELPDFEAGAEEKSRAVELARLKLLHATVAGKFDMTAGKYVVMSGAKAVAALRDFFDGKFALTGMKVLEGFEGLACRDITNADVAVLEETEFVFNMVEFAPGSQLYEGVDEIAAGMAEFSA